MGLERVAVMVLLLLIPTMTQGQTTPKAIEFNSMMMESTFKIAGPSQQGGQLAVGTGFLMAKEAANDAPFSHYVLITAAHVLSGIVGDTATLVIRTQSASG